MWYCGCFQRTQLLTLLTCQLTPNERSLLAPLISFSVKPEFKFERLSYLEFWFLRPDTKSKLWFPYNDHADAEKVKPGSYSKTLLSTKVMSRVFSSFQNILGFETLFSYNHFICFRKFSNMVLSVL